ncbi:hypothetical protein [Lactobacillus corticis]|uniref:Exosortase n=1 Tax=Lactobacillus corticis TaxID=2201249 RepID=A0A916QJ25_9LACO|nr:hypothetical protein [Lactobacillus corticis]GFZ26463.1 hypothetical protein LCB40_03430 [Lactobacillus corticis]
MSFFLMIFTLIIGIGILAAGIKSNKNYRIFLIIVGVIFIMAAIFLATPAGADLLHKF